MGIDGDLDEHGVDCYETERAVRIYGTSYGLWMFSHFFCRSGCVGEHVSSETNVWVSFKTFMSKGSGLGLEYAAICTEFRMLSTFGILVQMRKRIQKDFRIQRRIMNTPTTTTTHMLGSTSWCTHHQDHQQNQPCQRNNKFIAS